MLDRLSEMALLGALDKFGSLALAADSLGMALPSASRLLAGIEKELGFLVLNRSTRPAVLTPQGRQILPEVRKVLRAHARLRQLVEVVRAKPHGVKLKVSFPVNCARDALMVGVETFLSRYPEACVEVMADLGIERLLNGMCEVAYFGYDPNLAEIYAEALEPQVNLLLASRRYLEEHGEPQAVGDLIRHKVITRYSSNRTAAGELVNGKERYVLHADQPKLLGDAPYCLSQLVKGKGIALDLCFDYVEPLLRSGDVQPVLLGWHRPAWNNHIACHIRNKERPEVRELMSLITEPHNRIVPRHWPYWYSYFGVPIEPVLKEMRALRKTARR